MIRTTPITDKYLATLSPRTNFHHKYHPDIVSNLTKGLVRGTGYDDRSLAREKPPGV